jgi:hypothetical protein
VSLRVTVRVLRVLRVQAEKMAEEERLAAEEAAQMEEEMAALKSDEASLKMDGAEDANVDLNAVSGPDRRSDLSAESYQVSHC